jgi:phosphoserine phosphatase RsbU/P
MKTHLRIILIEDNSSDIFFIKRVLDKASFTYDIEVVDERDTFLKSINAFRPDIILSDHSLPSFNSLEAFRLARKIIPNIPFILVTGTVSEEFAVQCMKAGIDDYILKNSLLRLPTSIESLFKNREVRREKEIVESLHKELRMAYEEIEEKNKNIIDSLNYAKRIQDAMLPKRKMLNNLVPDSFIYYRPKDIVSGDFYWFEKVNNKILLAVADCTGHGVPGALMSMVGYNFLNAIASDTTKQTGSEILKALSDAVSGVLGKEQNDGMDMALCVIDRENNILEFTGANRPIVTAVEGKVKQFPGSKSAIGGANSTYHRFESQNISFKSGDSFYIFSDGFADQFGGPSDRKIMRRNFLNLIESASAKNMKLQEKMFHDYFEKWKSENDQTDDVLLIGFRL